MDLSYLKDLDFFRNKEKVLISASLACASAAYLIWRWFRKNPKPHFDGFVAPGFEKVALVFKQNIESGLEMGADFSAYYNGEMVLNLWGGYSDESCNRLRSENSTSIVFSATKGVTALCMALLVDRGLLDYKRKVSDYWPEFSQNGKENITVETLLSHQAGLYALSENYSLSMAIDDNAKLEKLLAKQKPYWEPGTKHGYHGITISLYCDQIIRKVDPKHRSLWKFYEEEIAIPYGIDFTIGEKSENFYRATKYVQADFGWFHTLFRTIPFTFWYCFTLAWYYIRYRRLYMFNMLGNLTDWDPKKLNNPDFRIIPNGSIFGFGTAKSLAKLYGILANNGVLLENSENYSGVLSVDKIDFKNFKRNGKYVGISENSKQSGKMLIGEGTIALLPEPLTQGLDHVILSNLNFGRAFMVMEINNKYAKKQRVFGHLGSGCQVGLCDLRNKIGWCYLTNYGNPLHGFINDKRYERLEKALYECLKDIEDDRGMDFKKSK